MVKSIHVSNENWKKLQFIKAEIGAKSLDQVISLLLEQYSPSIKPIPVPKKNEQHEKKDQDIEISDDKNIEVPSDRDIEISSYRNIEKVSQVEMSPKGDTKND